MRKRVAWKVYCRVAKLMEPYPAMLCAVSWLEIIAPTYKATTWEKAQLRMERKWRRGNGRNLGVPLFDSQKQGDRARREEV